MVNALPPGKETRYPLYRGRVIPRAGIWSPGLPVSSASYLRLGETILKSWSLCHKKRRRMILQTGNNGETCCLHLHGGIAPVLPSRRRQLCFLKFLLHVYKLSDILNESFRRIWTKFFRLLCYYVEQGGLKPTFRDHISLPYWRVNLSNIKDSLPLEYGTHR